VEFLPYTPQSIRLQTRTTVIGRRIEMHEQVGSTNDLAREAGRRGEPEGLLILAEEQTQGRGRLGRTWVAPPHTSILGSLLLRPRFSAQHAFHLTMAAALAIHDTCAMGDFAAFGMSPSIKWPNDVLVNGRKIAGVLSESEFSGGDWDFAVVGFGINANSDPEDLGPVQIPATSFAREMGSAIDRVLLLSRVLMFFEDAYLQLQNGQHRFVYERWTRALETVGRPVRVQEAGGMVEGTAVGVDPDGALLVRTASGERRRVLAGDVLTG
jgi:BirA family biotin operon repressor/biotin-[acetyl-CoA-carboxylase] ligase